VSVLVIAALMELFVGVWNAPPASLGELALREAVRRQVAPAPVRSVTVDDLEQAPPRPVRPSPPPTAGTMVEEVPPPTDPARGETWWRARMTEARTELERKRILVTALEGRVAALTREVANRDNPVERAALVADRLKALEELDTTQQELAAAAQAITDIEDEARRAGVPPGWLRGGLTL
jgi:hypothetical protein